jgi:hypothetical protein
LRREATARTAATPNQAYPGTATASAAQGPDHAEAKQGVIGLDVGGNADQRSRGQRPRQRRLVHRLPPEDQQPKQAGRGGQDVEVPGRDDVPQQQRVERPQQVSAQPAGRIGTQQPVGDERDDGERNRVPQLQPERDPGSGDAAELGRQKLLHGRQRPVDADHVLPADRHRPGQRVVHAAQVVGGHQVRAVAEHHDPAVGRVVERVG